MKIKKVLFITRKIAMPFFSLCLCLTSTFFLITSLVKDIYIYLLFVLSGLLGIPSFIRLCIKNHQEGSDYNGHWIVTLVGVLLAFFAFLALFFIEIFV